jgi:hypothetical protein
VPIIDIILFYYKKKIIILIIDKNVWKINNNNKLWRIPGYNENMVLSKSFIIVGKLYLDTLY